MVYSPSPMLERSVIVVASPEAPVDMGSRHLDRVFEAEIEQVT